MPFLPFDPKLIVTTETIPGYEIVASLGVAEGYQPYNYPGLAMSHENQHQMFTAMLSGSHAGHDGERAAT